MTRIHIKPIWRDPFMLALAALLVAIGVCLFCGCSSSGGGGSGSDYDAPQQQLPPFPDCKRAALVIGLASVQQGGAWGTWSGQCAGCVTDALKMRALTERCGVATCLLLTETATLERVRAEWLNIVGGLTAGDLAVFYISSHGGQKPDGGGDESDGLDEYLCLYDRALVDDEMKALLEVAFRRGIRVLMIVDTCNAGSMFMAVRPIGAEKAVGDFPAEFKGMSGPLVYIGASTDGTAAYDQVFTPRLLHTFRAGQTYGTWGQEVKALLRGQTVTCVEIGVSNGFRSTQALW